MDQQQVENYILINQKYFPSDKIMYLREKLFSADQQKFMMLTAVELKDPTILLVISIFLGQLGVDRFMLGDIGLGVLKLLTGGVCGILTIIDWFTVLKRTRELNFNNVILRI